MPRSPHHPHFCFDRGNLTEKDCGMSKVVNEDGTEAAAEKVAKEVVIKGVNLTISPDVFDDLDLLDAFDQIQNEGNGLRIAGALRKIAGGKYNELRSALRDKETGRISIDVAGEVFMEIMKEIAPNS